MADDTLLDVFVNIKPDPAWEEHVTRMTQEAVKKITDIFAAADVKMPKVKASSVPPVTVKVTADTTELEAKSKKAGEQAAKELQRSFREALLEFDIQKNAIQIPMRLISDPDTNDQLAKIQNLVRIEEDRFELATNDEKRKDSIEEVIRLRHIELGAMQAIVDEQVKAKGLETADLSKALQLRSVADDAARLNLEMRELAVLITRAGDSNLKEQFQTLRAEVSKTQLDLSQGIKTSNLKNVKDASKDIESQRVQSVDLADAATKAATASSVLDAKIQQANQKAQDLATTLSRVKDGLDIVSGDRLNAVLELSKNTAKDLGLELKRAIQNGADATAIDLFIEKLDQATIGAGQLRAQLTASSQITQEFEDIKKTEKRERQEFAVERKLSDATSVGLQSGALRTKAAQVTAEIQRTQLTFDHLVQDFNGSPESLDGLRRQLQATRGEVDGIVGRNAFKQIEKDVRQLNPNMNSLQNNAYQLGQAFEDAAVGFSLNGISGAVRGASNNITFLIQNMAVAQAQQQKLLGLPVSKLTQQLPLYASIAAALGLIFVEPVAKWIDSLDDVELKFSDIVDTFESAITDIDFEVGFRKTTRELERTLNAATDVKSVLKEIQDLNTKIADSSDEISNTFQGLAESGDFLKAVKDIELLSKALDPLVAQARKNAEKTVDTSTISPFFDPGQSLVLPEWEIKAYKKQLGDVLEIQKAIRGSRLDVLEAQRSVSRGADDSNERVIKANESIRDLLILIKKLGPEGSGPGKGVLDEKQLAKATEQVGLFAKTMEKIAGIAKDINDNQLEKMPKAWQVMIEKADEFEFTIRATRANLNGLVSDEAIELNDFLQGVLKQKEDLNDEIKAVLLNNAFSLAEINKVKNAIVQTQFGSDSNTLLAKIKEVQEKIEKFGKSKFTTFEQLSRDLQQNVLSGEDKSIKSMQELIKELQLLREVQAEMIRQKNEDLTPLSANDRFTGGKRLDEIEARRRAEVETKILPPFESFVDRLTEVRDEFRAAVGLPTGKPIDKKRLDIDELFPKSIPTSKGEVIGMVLEQFTSLGILIKDGIKQAMDSSAAKIVDSQDKTTVEVKKIKAGATAQ